MELEHCYEKDNRLDHVAFKSITYTSDECNYTVET